MELILSFLMCIFIGGVISGNILGNMRNKAGQTVFFIWKGIQVFRAMAKATYSRTPAQSIVRGKFLITSKFAAAVYSLSALAQRWKTITGSKLIVLNKIFKSNYIYASKGDLGSAATIVPPLTGFPVTTTDAAVDETSVAVGTDPIGTNTNIDTNIEKFIQLNAVIKCTDPKSTDGTPSIYYLPVKSTNVVLSITNPLTFVALLTDELSAIYSLYDTHLTYIALVTLDEAGNAVNNSTVFTV